MAVNMSNVKQIMHNNKEVIKIEDSLGHIIWQKLEAQPFRRLEYIAFDGTNYCDSAEHNAYNRAYRLDFEQTGWNDRGLSYPFGIWTSKTPGDILLTRNERSNTNNGFEVCRVGNLAYGQYPPETYMNQRIVAEMKWGSDTTISCRLRNQGSSDYIVNGSGTSSKFNNNNNGNFFIGAINDGGGGTPDNANGMLVGKIYEVAIAGSNSFDDYGYAYVPCQRKSDGAIGFKQPHLTGDDSFHPLRNKADGSIVTDVTAHMGPVVEEEWDGVTYTIQPSPEAPYMPQWHTLWSGSQNIRAYGGRAQSGSVIGNNVTLVNAVTIPTDTVQLRVTFSTYELTFPEVSEQTKTTVWVPNPKVSSPWTTTLQPKTYYGDFLGGWLELENKYSTGSQYAVVYLQYMFTNNQLSIKTFANKRTNSSNNGRVNARLVVTRIEAYY